MRLVFHENCDAAEKGHVNVSRASTVHLRYESEIVGRWPSRIKLSRAIDFVILLSAQLAAMLLVFQKQSWVKQEFIFLTVMYNDIQY